MASILEIKGKIPSWLSSWHQSLEYHELPNMIFMMKKTGPQVINKKVA